MASSIAVAQDHDFVAEATALSGEQVELGRLALDRSGSEDVRRFARQMVDDHAKAGDGLRALPRVGTRPAPTTGREAGVRARLTTLAGRDFDRAYMDRVVAVLRDTIALYEREQQAGSDAKARQFASDTLTVLQGQWKIALSAQGAARQQAP